MLGAAARGIVEHHRRRVAAAPGPVVARDRPGEPLLGLAPAGVEHRHAGLVGEQSHRGVQDLAQARHHGPDLEGGRAHPAGQHLAADLDALPRQALCLAVQRRVVGVARHRDMRDRRLGRHAALDQARRGGRLHDDARAGPAGELRPLGDQGAELHRDHVEPLGGVAADLDHRALAAGAGGALGHEHLLDPRQVRRQAAAARPGAGWYSSCAGRASAAPPRPRCRRARPRPPRRRIAVGPRSAAPSADRTACAAACAAGAAAARSALPGHRARR